MLNVLQLDFAALISLIKIDKKAAITPVQKLENPISYTFSEPSGRQLSHGGTLDIRCSSKISLNLTKCKKLPVFAFFRDTLQKKFK